MIASVIDMIQKTEERYICKVEKFYEKESTKNVYVNSLSSDLEDCFKLKEIQTTVR